MKLTKNKKQKIENEGIELDNLSKESRAVYDRLFTHYENIEILTLREIGKQIGLKSATTYSKNELTKKVALTQAANLIRIDLSDGEKREVTTMDALSLVDDYHKKSFVVNPAVVQGVVEVFDTEAWLRPKLIRDEMSDVFVPLKIVNDFGLKSGDFINGKARAIEKANRLGLFEVEKINDIKAEVFERKAVYNKRVDRQDSFISFDGGEKVHQVSQDSPFIKGEAKLVINKNLAYEFMAAFRRQMIIPIGLMLDDDKIFKSGAEISASLSCDKQSNGVCSQSSAVSGSYSVFSLSPLETLKADEAIDLLLEYAKTIENCVIIVDNADSLSKESIAKLMQACGNFERGSVSLLMFVNLMAITDKVNWMARVVNSTHNTQLTMYN